MKRKTITAVLSIVLAATSLTGCSMPEKPGSLIRKSDSQTTSTDLNTDESGATDETTENVTEETTDEAPVNTPEENISDEISETVEDVAQDIFEDGSVKDFIKFSAKAPAFKIANKNYSIKYEGDATFDESNDYSKDYSNGILFEGNYQYLMMDDECKDDYPLLYEAVNSDAIESMKKSDGYANSMADEARLMLEEAAENGTSFYGPFSDESFLSVTRSDDVVLSVYDYNSDYTGGAHGMYGAGGTNYDVKTGEKLDISDVIDIDKEQLDGIIKDELYALAKTTGAEFEYFDSTLEDKKFNPESDAENGVYEFGYNWYFSYDGLHVIFNPYDIGTYAEGMQDIVIGYDEYQNTIKEKFIPEGNIDHIYKDRIYFITDENDYNDPELHFTYTPEEGEYYDGFMVASKFALVKDGKSAEVDMGFFVNNQNSFDIYRVVTKTGREYVYLFIPTESDYSKLVVFDITDDVKYVDTQPYHELYENLNNGFYLTPILTDPYDMRLGNVGNNFGTYTYYGDYEIGADGLPTLTSDVYHLVWKSKEAYSKTDIKGDEVNIDGKTLKSGVTIPKGEHFVPFRTDRKSYMDFYLDDGRIIRLTYEKFEYPASIPEGNIDDLFEGLEYAG